MNTLAENYTKKYEVFTKYDSIALLRINRPGIVQIILAYGPRGSRTSPEHSSIADWFSPEALYHLFAFERKHTMDASPRSRAVELQSILSGKSGNGRKWNRECLVDAFLTLNAECSGPAAHRAIPGAETFMKKYEIVAKELKSLRPSKKDFDVIRTIGRGHFGEVHVVREKKSEMVYAMKTLRKVDMLAQENTAFFEEEKEIMACANSSWITSLHCGFQDDEFLYLVMEYHPGGDLLALLGKHDDVFEEKTARFYLAEMVEAIRALHLFGFVHRDVKPDNVLICQNGHIKLADFGSAAKLSPGSKTVKSQMPVGTPDYIAPEVLSCINGPSCSYGSECDWWSLGIVAYEMIFGETPFTHDTVGATYSSIMNHANTLSFPDDMEASSEVKNLIQSLLCSQSKRIGYEAVKAHPFFAAVNFSQILSSTPPYIPILSGIDDTSNFDELSPKPADPGRLLQQEMRANSRAAFTGKDLPFIGFTYTSDLERIANHSTNAPTASPHPRTAPPPPPPPPMQELVDLKREKEIAEKERALFEADVKALTRQLNMERDDRSDFDTKALKTLDEVRKWYQNLLDAKDDDAKAVLNEREESFLQLNKDFESQSRRYHQAKEELKSAQLEIGNAKEKYGTLKRKAMKMKNDGRKEKLILEDKAEKLKKEKVELASKAEQLQREMNKLTRESSQKTSANSDADLNRAKAEAKKARDDTAELLEAKAKQDEEIAQLRSKLEETVEVKDSLEVEVDELRRRMEDEVEKDKEKLCNTEMTVETLQAKVVQLSQCLDKAQDFQVKRWREKIHRAESSQREAEKKLEEVRDKANQAEVVGAKLTSKTKECEELWETNKILNESLKERDAQNEDLRDTIDELKLVMKSRKTEMEYQKETIDKLKETCRLLEIQTEEQEVMIDEVEEKVEKAIKAKNSLETQLDHLNETLQNVQQQLAREKEFRRAAEERVAKINGLLKESETAHQQELGILEEALVEQKENLTKATDQLRCVERALAVKEVDCQNWEKRVQDEIKEQERMQLEMKKLNKEIGFSKASVLKLNRELDERNSEAEKWKSESAMLTNKVEAVTSSLNEERFKAETREAQQAKLIDLLQTNSGLTKSTWKKKMATTPGSKQTLTAKRRNQDLARAEQWKEFQKGIKQTDQAPATSPPLPPLKSASDSRLSSYSTNGTSDPPKQQTTDFGSAAAAPGTMLTVLQQSPGNQPSPQVSTSAVTPAPPPRSALIKRPAAATSTGASPPSRKPKQRMHHNIPHRLIQARCKKTKACAVCSSVIHFGKQMSKCQHCKSICHVKCSSALPATCGLPMELVDHYVTETMKRSVAPSPAAAMATSSLESAVKEERSGPSEGCWVKVLKSNGCWELLWAKLVDKQLLFYDASSKENADVEPVNSISFSSSLISVHSTISSAELPGVVATDLPFVLSVEIAQATKCWPTQTVYLLVKSAREKQGWIADLQKEASINKMIPEKKTSLETIVVLENSSLDINCSLQLARNILLIACGKGLFTLHVGSLPKTKKVPMGSKVLQEIPGQGYIHDMERIGDTDNVLMIKGHEMALVNITTKDLVQQVASGSGSLSVPESVSVCEITGCKLVSSGKIGDRWYICAAISKWLLLLTYKQETATFELVKEFGCGDEIVSCVSFTPSRIIVGTSKFFFIDPVTHEIEDLYDECLSSKSGSKFPMMAFHVGNNEVLLCYSEYGVFVDSRGVQTRSNQLTWSRMPRGFAYRSPYLYVNFLNSIEVVDLRTKSSSLLELSNPRLLNGLHCVMSTTPGSITLFRLDHASLPSPIKRPLSDVNYGTTPRGHDKASRKSMTSETSISISEMLSDSLMSGISASSPVSSPKRFKQTLTEV
ncbi:citron Rho-interacting kinase-like isoform X2 [Oscarella lobularis]|uniref:citron Rho-interacting kinase-like isoform X2 n=1 Tax=Oscarella lobularis TaxID=121494 RepID=UPI003313AE98